MDMSCARPQETIDKAKHNPKGPAGPLISWSRDHGFKGCLWGLVLVVVGAAFILSHLRASPRSPDEQAYLAWAVSFALEGKILEPDGSQVNKNVPPLHVLMVGLAFKSLGINTEAAQAVSVLGGALGVGVCFLLGWLVLGVRGGLLAALLFLTSGKGEIWEYSNRVLNDIHLTLWISCILFFGMAYIRWGTPWMAFGMGSCLGLGFLTKESTLLAFPVVMAAFFLGNRPRSTRLVHFLVAMAVAGSLMAPLLLHRYRAIQLRVEAQKPGYGLRAGNLATLLNPEKWGFRGLEELGNNLLLRGMPSAAFKIIYGVSLLGCLVLVLKRKAPKELILPFVLIFFWIGVFQTFLHLPMTRRQLVPLFPAYSVLATFFLVSCWRFIRFRILMGRLHPKSVAVVGCGAAVALGFLNMSPQAFSGLSPGRVFHAQAPAFLQKQAMEALACASDASLIASNYDRALYFFLKGRIPVLHLKAPELEQAQKPGQPGKPKKHGRPPTRERSSMEDKISSLKQDLLGDSKFFYGIIFNPRAQEGLGPTVLMDGFWEVICEGEGFWVYRWQVGKKEG